QLGQQIEAGDDASARRTLAVLQARTAAARGATTGPAWWLATGVPVVRADVIAVRDMSACVDDLAHRVFPELLALKLSVLVPAGGQCDPGAVRAAAPALATAQADPAAVAARLDRIDAAGLIAPIAGAVTKLRAQVTRLASLTAQAYRGAALLPSLLGVDGP